MADPIAYVQHPSAPRHARLAETESFEPAGPALHRQHREHRWLKRLLIAIGIIFATFIVALAATLAIQRNLYADETVSPRGEAIIRACHEVPSPGKDLCAMWVSQVYAKALDRYPTGNANDMYERLTSTDRSELEPGMAIAVSTHPHTEAGRQYGHIGIYLGEGRVMDNVGSIRTTPLDWWIWHYGASVPVRWGWL